MTWLALAALFWIAIHVGLAGSGLRDEVAGRVGENGFRGLFSALSAIGILWLAVAYRSSEFYGLWVTDDWLRWLALLLMLPASLLFVGSVTVRNPTAVGGERALAASEPATGFLRITRHPMLWAFALWAIAHLLANGDLASLLLFGSILIVALAGMKSIDRKRARRTPTEWDRFAARTSILPFRAIAEGRTRLRWGEIGWWRPALGAALWLLLILVHPLLVGAPALPGG